MITFKVISNTIHEVQGMGFMEMCKLHGDQKAIFMELYDSNRWDELYEFMVAHLPEEVDIADGDKAVTSAKIIGGKL